MEVRGMRDLENGSTGEWEYGGGSYYVRERWLHCPTFSLQRMKELGRRTSPDIKQIDIDVLRTFRDNIMYKDRYGIK